MLIPPGKHMTPILKLRNRVCQSILWWLRDRLDNHEPELDNHEPEWNHYVGD